MEGWSTCRLGELVTVKHGWPFKSEFFREPPGELPIVVAVGNFRYTGGFRFNETPVKGYAGDYPPEFDLHAGDILLVMTCQTAGGEILGVPARVPADGRRYLHNQRLGRVQIDHPDRVDNGFLYSLFRWWEFNQHLFATSSGTKILHTAPSRIADFAFALPPLDEQRAIAVVLGALDDKIEANRALNETLEATCQALFRSWFVDLDPVVAKSEGRRPPHLTDEVATLFPDRFEDSPLGPVPAGWTPRALPECFEINPTRPLARGQVAPYLDMKNMPTHAALPNEWTERAFGSGLRFINGDTLLARITPCLENGKTAFVTFLSDGEVGWGSTEYIVLRSKPPLPLEYSYFMARTDDFRGHSIANMTGSSGRQRVPVSCYDKYLVPSPNARVASLFGDVAGPALAQMRANILESRTLGALRDALLPRLLSGDRRLRQAERLVEEAV